MGKGVSGAIILIFVVVSISVLYIFSTQVEQPHAPQESYNYPTPYQSPDSYPSPYQTPVAFETFTSNPNLREISHNGDLIISEGVHTIDNSKFVIKGNIVINGTGKLVVKDAELHFQQDYNTQYWVKAAGNSKVEMDSVKIFTNGKWMLFDYRGNANVKLNAVQSKDPNIPWHGTGDSAVVYVTDSTIGMTPWTNVTLTTKNSNLFLELGFSGANGTFKLPMGYEKNFDLEILGDEGVLRLDTDNSTFRAWGTTLFRKSNITFVDTKMTIGIDAGADWSIWPGPLNPHVEVSGLKAMKYDDFILNYETNALRLVNTEVTSWYPQAFREATVEISDSDLADVSSNGQNAHLIIRRSKAQIATARENVTYEFYDSEIEGDVVAQDTATIHLYRTKVGGKILEIGEGKIFVDGKRT